MNTSAGSVVEQLDRTSATKAGQNADWQRIKIAVGVEKKRKGHGDLGMSRGLGGSRFSSRRAGEPDCMLITRGLRPVPCQPKLAGLYPSDWGRSPRSRGSRDASRLASHRDHKFG